MRTCETLTLSYLALLVGDLLVRVILAMNARSEGLIPLTLQPGALQGK